jgi:hypothetical protein
MGNHQVGSAMASAAEGFWAGNGNEPVTKERALAVLDAAAKRWIGADAEFDDELCSDQPLGRLICIAFGPWTEEDERNDQDGEGYYEGIECPFRDRYKFC